MINENFLLNLKTTSLHSLKMFVFGLALICGWLTFPCLSESADAADDSSPTRWARFRGPNGAGIATGQNLPKDLKPEHREWVVDLPGLGHAAPAIWDDFLFVTSAIDEGAVRYLYCLDAITGEERWVRTLSMNKSAKHIKSSWASSTPVTDGEFVYVAFADAEQYLLSAYDFAGELQWREDLGSFESQHGQGTSPVLYEDLVILANDQDGPSSVVAFEKATGKMAWTTLRESRRVSYATPLMIPPAGGKGLPQLIVACGAMGLTSLNPRTGHMHWKTGEFSHRTVGSPVYGEGVLVQCCGGGGQGKYMVAIKPHDAPNSDDPFEVLYEHKRRLPYVPTPIIYEGHLYLCNDGGIANCLNVETGENVWTERIGGNYSSSPVCVDGMIYMLSEDGEIVVISASPDYKLWGRLKLDDHSHATPAVANGRLYLRTFHRLTSIHHENSSVDDSN
ncbi:outer membrane biogenesis protein BamB [Polystyrenella longa]|uniref:Outer membrane biogenesis protein BamB n=1 Tax=Polystyrenella longa TaxID=2528007 RepID=A0A518CKK8_9PLAN|nr:PQQ-binding-like beta-propeller repeat protein [Polystyrenella longa]QDU79759.1 outer membrane biogenesis protein BamB [Polystyrenella longa]